MKTSALSLCTVILLVLSSTVFPQQENNNQINNAHDTIPVKSDLRTGLSFIDQHDNINATTTVGINEQEGAAYNSLADALQGRIAGLNIISPSGEPGNRAQMILRGLDLNGLQQPLIVIDGIPWQRNGIDFSWSIINMSEYRSLIPVALSDIESVEIIKDASATALYGSAGADGVLLIRTKTGSPGKIHANYQFSGSILPEPKYIDMLNGEQYIMEQLEAWHNAYGIFDVPYQLAYNQDSPDFYNYSANTDWLDAISQRGHSGHHYFSVSGGNVKNRVRASADYVGEKGTTINTGYDRLLTRANYEHNFNEKLSLAIEGSYVFDKYDGNFIINKEYAGIRDVLQMAFIQSPNMSIMEHDADGNLTGNYFTPQMEYLGDGRYYYNPVAVSELGDASKTISDIQASGYISYDINPHIKLRESLSFGTSSNNSESFLPAKALGYESILPDQKNLVNLTSDWFRSETRGIFSVPFKDEQKQALSASLAWITRHNENMLDLNRWISEGFTNSTTINGNAAAASLLYKLRNRYIINAGARIEANNYYADDSRDIHDNISLGWQFSEEPFFKNVNFLGRSILRAGWGKSEFRPTPNYSINSFYISPDQNNITSYDIGLETNLFNDKLCIESDFYQKRIPLLQLKESYVKYKGLEIMTQAKILDTKNWKWTAYFNITHIIQDVVPIYIYTPMDGGYNQTNIIFPIDNDNGIYSTNYKDIRPGALFGLVYNGVYLTEEDTYARDTNGNIIYNDQGSPVKVSYGQYSFEVGDAKYADINGDGKINYMDVTKIGNYSPKNIGGFGCSLQFRNLSFSFNFKYQTGYEINNEVKMYSESLSTRNNQNLGVLNRWRNYGDEQVTLPRAYLNHPANNLISDRYIESADFLRLNYISLEYSLNQDICRKIHLDNLSVLLSAQRILTFTKYSGLDPEINQPYYPFSIFSSYSENNLAYPMRVITMTLRVGI